MRFRSSVLVLDACVAISLLEGAFSPPLPLPKHFKLTIQFYCFKVFTIFFPALADNSSPPPPPAASEKQTQMGGGGHAMHGHVTGRGSSRPQESGDGVSQGGMGDPSEAAGRQEYVRNESLFDL